MTTAADGSTTCNVCGGDASNGGVFAAVVVATVDVLTSQVHNLHACRAPKGKDGTDPTCADQVMDVFMPHARDFPHSRAAADAVLAEQGVLPVETETLITEAVPVPDPEPAKKAARKPRKAKA